MARTISNAWGMSTKELKASLRKRKGTNATRAPRQGFTERECNRPFSTGSKSQLTGGTRASALPVGYDLIDLRTLSIGRRFLRGADMDEASEAFVGRQPEALFHERAV